MALSGGEDRTLKLWDLNSGELISSTPAHWKGIYSVALSDDGRTALSGSADKTMKLWELPSS
jgi:WD40 repeat protein